VGGRGPNCKDLLPDQEIAPKGLVCEDLFNSFKQSPQTIRESMNT
jgi:hypothetical protein